jgi:hypothetical protein
MTNLFQIQQGVVAKLQGDVALMALIVGVYDDVPQAALSESNAAYPFIVVGDDTFNAWDTDTELGFESEIQIHVWSRYRGKKELVDIFGKIYDALNRQEIVTTFHVLDINHTNSNSFLEPDGRTRHGITSYLINYEE